LHMKYHEYVSFGVGIAPSLSNQNVAPAREGRVQLKRYCNVSMYFF